MIHLILGAVLAAATPSDPPARTDPPAVAAKPKRGDPSEVICRTQPEPGSHMANRVCGTRAQWEASDRDLQKFFHDELQQGSRRAGNESATGAGGYPAQ